MNAQQLRCVVEEALQGLSTLIPVWYEQPRRLQSGHPVPIGLAFTTPLNWSQIEQAAAHPYVAAVEPPPGGAAAALGLAGPSAPCECPTNLESSAGKLDELETIRGSGRQPAIIELKPQLLSAPPNADAASEDAEHVLWERAVLNRRHLTCVGRALDAVLHGPSMRVDYLAGHVAFSTPPLPPWGALAATIEGFGVGLTWDEAGVLAAHPYIDRIWTYDGLEAHQDLAGCPTDLAAPVLEPKCTGERESVEGKVSVLLERRRQDPGPHEVIVQVAGGATVCPLLSCPRPPNPCLERDVLFERYRRENVASQRCVRELVSTAGGTVIEQQEDFVLVNGFLALLTLPQIDDLAAPPHVKFIEPNMGDLIPPPALP